MSIATQPAESTTDAVLENLGRHVYLVFLNIGWPKLSYQIADAIVEVIDGEGNKTTIAEAFHNKPQWSLMPEDWHKKFVKLEGRARDALHRCSVGFATRGMSVMPVTKAGPVFEALTDYREQLMEYRDQFSEHYSEVLKNLKDQLDPAVYIKATQKLPRSTDIAQKFYMNWAIFPMGGSGINVPLQQLEFLREFLAGLRQFGSGPVVFRTLSEAR